VTRAPTTTPATTQQKTKARAVKLLEALGYDVTLQPVPQAG
jgi:hypothetical protein